jgi:hypothetical protein
MASDRSKILVSRPSNAPTPEYSPTTGRIPPMIDEASIAIRTGTGPGLCMRAIAASVPAIAPPPAPVMYSRCFMIRKGYGLSGVTFDGMSSGGIPGNSRDTIHILVICGVLGLDAFL